jgi:hypothetical protein
VYDVIPNGNILVLVGDDGLNQYYYSNVTNITLLSKTSVLKTENCLLTLINLPLNLKKIGACSTIR